MQPERDHRDAADASSASSSGTACDVRTYTSPNQSSKILSALLDQPAFLFDTNVWVGGTSFPCHRAILSAASPVFRAMFSSRMKERATGVLHLPADLIGTSSFAAVRLYMYGRPLRVSSGDVLQLSTFVRTYEIGGAELVAFFNSLLSSALTLPNCLHVKKHGLCFGDSSLVAVCDRFVAVRMKILASEDAFLNLAHFDDVKLYLDAYTNVQNVHVPQRCHEYVCTAAMSWLLYPERDAGDDMEMRVDNVGEVADEQRSDTTRGARDHDRDTEEQRAKRAKHDVDVGGRHTDRDEDSECSSKDEGEKKETMKNERVDNHLDDVLGMLRLDQMSLSALLRVSKQSLVSRSPLFQHKLLRAFQVNAERHISSTASATPRNNNTPAAADELDEDDDAPPSSPLRTRRRMLWNPLDYVRDTSPPPRDRERDVYAGQGYRYTQTQAQRDAQTHTQALPGFSRYPRFAPYPVHYQHQHQHQHQHQQHLQPHLQQQFSYRHDHVHYQQQQTNEQRLGNMYYV